MLGKSLRSIRQLDRCMDNATAATINMVSECVLLDMGICLRMGGGRKMIDLI